jgi:hypothetical protein
MSHTNHQCIDPYCPKEIEKKIIREKIDDFKQDFCKEYKLKVQSCSICLVDFKIDEEVIPL